MDLKEFLKLKVNGMDAPRYLASNLLSDSNYHGEKYYKMEDKFTEIITNTLLTLEREAK